MDEERDDKACQCGHGLSRRGFIASIGTGAVAAAAVATTEARPQVLESKPPEMTQITLRINGREHRLLVEPRWTLLFVIRERLQLTGTKVGCERGECGACTVLMDGKARYACLTLAVEAEGHEVTTLEGLMRGEELGPVQKAFAEQDAFQCGYCTPGQIMAVEGLLRENPSPSPDEIRRGVSGNICRCGTYAFIFKAARQAAELKKQGGTSA
ncbi:MAG: (2Fe-2S)-binding protein [Vicinamibacterales bacterium]